MKFRNFFLEQFFKYIFIVKIRQNKQSYEFQFDIVKITLIENLVNSSDLGQSCNFILNLYQSDFLLLNLNCFWESKIFIYLNIRLMMMLIYAIILNSTWSFEIEKIDSQYQVAQQLVKIRDYDFQLTKYFSYGIWSKYTPLSAIPQTGPVGLFDSNCYHIHNILDRKRNEINLIYYDCLDYEAKKITKALKFVNNEDEQKEYVIEVEIFYYESFWYFLEVLQWPLQKRFEILIISQQQIVLHSIDEIKYPFFGEDLSFNFGNSLIVVKSRIESIQKNQKFSYFPGIIMIQKFQILDELTIIDWFDDVKSLFVDYENCYCNPNEIVDIQDLNINSLQKGLLVSQNQNCDSFFLQGWVKIQEIIKKDNQFIYPFIKLAANYESSLLTSDNLSPFQIQYQISDIQNQVIVKTYSYTFPTVTIDFSNNPFLIEKSFDIVHSINLWHKIKVELIGNSIDIQIKFYEQLMIHEYRLQLEVNQFQSYQFKLLYGNIQSLNSNYLHILLRNFYFSNCDQPFSDDNCHYNCEECDGPTKEDCLSCSKESKRIYLPEHKVCICPYNTIDDQICIDYEEVGLEFIDETFLNNECPYGYFELDNECLKCPSIIRKDLITCTDCLQNPKSFSQYPYCENDLHINQAQQTEELQWSYPDQLLFDGNDFNYFGSWQFPINDFKSLYLGFLYRSSFFPLYCNKEYENCDSQQIDRCKEQVTTVVGVRCNGCKEDYILKDNYCISQYVGRQKNCLTPYYKSSNGQCKLCSKKNCIYCFEYQKDESSIKSTLFQNFESFNNDEMIQIGCAMCVDGFMFDFIIGECLSQQSKIQTCLRSFINLDGIEICTLSSQNDFSVAPEIINCEKYYSNCLQCVLSPKSRLQCIFCRQGFVSSITSGTCQLSGAFLPSNYATSNIQGGNQADAHVQLIQSFQMQFLPDSYYYLNIPESIFEVQFDTAWRLPKDVINFVCLKCPLNYYKQTMRAQLEGQCVVCSNLCQYCEMRTQEEIFPLNANFQLQESNAQFITKCLKPNDDPNIAINPYYNNVKYCFNKVCINWFSFSIYFNYCINNRYSPGMYEMDMNFQYCNQVGVDYLTIDYIISIQEENQNCDSIKLILLNDFKSTIFSLKKTHMRLYSVHKNILGPNRRINITNYDSVELKNITFKRFSGCVFGNRDKKVEITLNNSKLINTNYLSVVIFITQIYGNILIQDVEILDSVFVDSTFFEFQKQSDLIPFKIKNLTFKNCILKNSTLFNIDYIQDIATIENIIIQNCSLLNSSFFSLQTILNRVAKIILQDVEINQCNFDNSFFLKGYSNFDIEGNNLFFHHNNLFNSVIIAFNDNTDLLRIRTSYNTLIESSILSTLLQVYQKRLVCTIDDFEDNFSAFQESSLIIIYSNLQINNFIVNIKNVKVQKNNLFGKLHLKNQLFKLHCHSLKIQNAYFFNLQKLAVFYLYQSNQIVFDSIIFENFQQKYKVPVSQLCTDLEQFRNQPFQVLGFQQLSLSNIKIINQFSINYSLMDINFSNQYIIDTIGMIILTNIEFRGNIIILNKLATSISLLNIYSQYNLNIKSDNFKFMQNVIHSQIYGTLITQINLLHINSLDSFVQLLQVYFYQNALTNSTNPFITLSAAVIEISNLTFMNSNVLSQKLWEQFYDFELEDQHNQQEINYIIESTFNMQNSGIYIVASTFSCKDSLFQDIIAIKSSVFLIQTQGQGIIKISNLQIYSIYNNLKDSGGSGCITVDSTSSLLSIDIKQIKFTNIFNRMAASVFTITPSLRQNVIRLTNIEIQNCLSLMNTIMLVKFSADVMKQSLVSINKLYIYQSEEFWFQLFSLIGSILSSELVRIQSEENAMFFFENCKIDIQYLIIEGIVISPILKIQNAFKLKLFDCKLEYIQKLYSFDLIQITQTTRTESMISIEKLKIIQSSTYKEKQNGIPIFSDLNYKISGCTMWRNTSITQQPSFSDIINQIQSSVQSNQLIYVKSISDQNSLMFQQIQIINNNGSDFSNGIITFEVEQFKIFKIKDIFCFQNSVKEHGCIYFFIQNYISSIILIKDSYFIQNKGSLGGALLIQNVRLRMTNCKIISNSVSKSGGGLFLQLNESDFQIEQTIITNNEASDGGGIFFNQDANILLHNFMKSFLLLNRAKQFGDNLIESPNHLTLLINNMQMPSKKYTINKTLNHHLELQPYRIIQQGKPLITNYLMIPSHQVINEYQIYQPSSNQYFSYISNFALILKNSLNEQLMNLLSTTCILTNKIIYEESLNQVDEEAKEILLQFDLEKDYYNLGSLSFILDPYIQEKKLLQIEINCKSSQHQQSLNYMIQVKSLKCQLGEFYVNSGCQICSSIQGFYSVVYDATKCSIFDKTKFKNITENNIELLEGFWRPNFLSDSIEHCFKNIKFCKGGWGQGNQICDQGHIGALCEECDIYNVRGEGKYFQNQQDSQCISCFGVEDSIIPFIAGSIWSFISIIITLRSIEQSNQLFKSLKLKQRFSKIIFNLEQGHEGFLIKMLLNYLWIFAVIFTFNIQFSFSFTFVDSVSNTSYSMTNNLDCYLSENQSIKLIYSKIITMLLLMTIQFLLIIMGYLIYNQYKKIGLSNFNLETISNTLLYLYVSNYGGLVKMYFSIVSKRVVSNQSYIQGDVSLLFGSQEHVIWISSFVIPGIVIFSVIIPLSIFIVMYIKKDQHDNIKIRKHFCYLINEYNKRNYFWEEIKLIKKTIIILILTYFETYILLKASLLGLCLLFYQLFAFNMKPYILFNFNNKDLSSAQICSIAIFLGAAKYVAEQENNLFSSILLQTIIVLLCLKLCYSFIKSILEVYSNKYTFLILNYLLIILNKISKESILTEKLQTYLLKQRQKNQRLKILISKLRQHLLKVSKGQLEYHRKIVSSQNYNTQKLKSDQKYLLKIETE
ncbi:unnamed protein product [Paramecium octaurelia]|uniref:Transmembrane protein n=1 Tax=Paramecium octaurelia TaxID=43137 RepID=A0A8S1Y8W6_PAROT|nr:unnamed protein product [Paramecium octaurelia]